MPLVTLKDLTADALRGRYAVGMFNTLNLEMVRGVLGAAEELRSPVIIAVAEVHTPYSPLSDIGPVLVRAAERARVPVAVHLDHGVTMETIRAALDIGFSSVMYDGSTLDFETNIANTREVVALAGACGASVEAELGHVGGGEAGTEDEGTPASSAEEAFYTDVEQAADFVARTGCDALAVAIGTVHGVYRTRPRLDLQRLEDIRRRAQLPIVLHGGSGLSDGDFHDCIQRGVAKINICTDMFIHIMESVKTIAKTGSYQYTEVISATDKAVKETVMEKLRLFGSTGKAPADSGRSLV